MLHELKVVPGPYRDLLSGKKKHEWRKDDRGFQAGDFLYLREWDEGMQTYTGRASIAEVTYVSKAPDFGIPRGYCVMSVEVLGSRSRELREGDIYGRRSA